MVNVIVNVVGAFCFGAVIGWITYRTLHRREGGTAISDIAVVIGAIGGAGVTVLFDTQYLFSCYCIGLAGGFFGYFFFHRRYNNEIALSRMFDQELSDSSGAEGDVGSKAT